MKKFFHMIFTLVFVFSFVSCAWADSRNSVRLAYVKWSTEIASASVIKAVFQEELGISCSTVPMKADEMWASVANGDVDGMVAAWLPTTHKPYYEKYKDQVEDLGPNLMGTKIGLVIPKVCVGRQTGRSGIVNDPYIKAQSIEDLNEFRSLFKSRIIGIDLEAGIMSSTREAIKVYGLDKFRLIDSSEQKMTEILENAIKRQQWVVVTGWQPHWMFGKWKLQFLSDPKKIFGGEEAIHTIVRKGLKLEKPKVYDVLDKFYWTVDEIEQVMVWINEDQGQFPYEKAMRWIMFNKERVRSWIR